MDKLLWDDSNMDHNNNDKKNILNNKVYPKSTDDIITEEDNRNVKNCKKSNNEALQRRNGKDISYNDT